MIVISYYTNNGSYPEEADLFRASLDRAGMEHLIVQEKDRGDWYANTAYKPEFIRRMRKVHGGPLLYLDVDAFVHENCEAYFNELDADFGAHWFRGPAKGHDRTDVSEKGRRMLSGTLFIGDTDGARHFLDDWIHLNQLLKERGIAEGGGQKNLWYLTTCVDYLTVERLPGRYCYVFDKAWAYPDEEPCVIEHTIASRDHRGGEPRQTRSRARRIARLREAVEADEEAPHPRGTAHDKALLSRLENAEEARHAAAKALSVAKRTYQDALAEELNARKETGR